MGMGSWAKGLSAGKWKIRPEQLVMIAGGLFFIGIVVDAMIPNDIQVDVDTARSGPAQGQAHLHRQVRGDAVNTPANAPVNAPATAPQQQMGAWGQQNSQPLQMQNVRQLQPMKVAATEPYQGRITQVINRDPGGWGQIHVMVQAGALKQEISLAPEWYLTFQGCTVKEGDSVTGEAFKFDKIRPGAVHYARHITVNGVRCRLRSVDGLALWGDQLR